MDKAQYIAEAGARLEAAEMTWNFLTEHAVQVIVFGSWAVEMHTDTSDLDLLCIGEGKRKKTRLLDIIWIRPESRFDTKWLGSELANHVACFGKWIHGEDDWSTKVFISERAVAFKRRLLNSRVRMLQRNWHELAPPYRKKHFIKLRRDAQRLAALVRGMPILSTPQFDDEWKRIGSVPCLLQLLTDGGIADTSLFERPMIAKEILKESW
jgi:hypothetical protein